MAKRTLAWHKDAFKNWTASHEQKSAYVKRQQEELARDEKHLEFYRQQIEEAEHRNLKDFDAEKFLLKRRKPLHKDDLKVGMVIVSDNTVNCLPRLTKHLVEMDNNCEFFVRCSHGRHFLVSDSEGIVYNFYRG